MENFKIQPRKGDIFMANLERDPLTKKSGIRPVVIVQNNKGNAHSGSIIAVVITGKDKKPLPTHVMISQKFGLKVPSTALCEHIITIDKSCLLDYMGTLVNTGVMKKLDDALKVSLALTE